MKCKNEVTYEYHAFDSNVGCRCSFLISTRTVANDALLSITITATTSRGNIISL